MKQTFTEWYEKNSMGGDLRCPPMTNEEFENFLIKYLLDDYFGTDSFPTKEQARTQLLTTILCIYSESFRKEIQKYEKK